MARTKPPADGKHRVQPGEWVAKIAANYGYLDWEHDVWMRSENQKLREARKDPHQLAENDVLFIPPWTEKKETCANEQVHKFKLKPATEVLRLELRGEDGKPLKNEAYQLEIDYEPGSGGYVQKNKATNGSGVLEERIPFTSLKGTLRLTRLAQTITLRLGYLCPMDPARKELLIKGAQQRLLALGYNPGATDGVLAPRTRAAVAAFQQFCADNKGKGDARVTDAGAVTGELTEETRAALIKFYGC